jgi:putative acetyltransferase
MSILVREDDLQGPEIAELLKAHLEVMASQSPPESRHALDLDALQVPEITFWTAWKGTDLLGAGALKELDRNHGEIKSMHTKAAARGQGIARTLLEHIMNEAVHRKYRRLSLETGSMEGFVPARTLYLRHGFAYCPPFAEYEEDPNSMFMTKILDQRS